MRGSTRARTDQGEKRELLKEIDPQISEGRQWFLDMGWHASGAADPWTQAQWVAQKLLNPRESWATISGLDPDLLPSVIRACHEFARRAMLTLPHRSYPTVDIPR